MDPPVQTKDINKVIGLRIHSTYRVPGKSKYITVFREISTSEPDGNAKVTLLKKRRFQ